MSDLIEEISSIKHEIQGTNDNYNHHTLTIKKMVSENEKWKKQVVMDVSDYTPEKIKTMVEKAVNTHIPSYQLIFDDAIKQVEQISKEKRRKEWIDNLSIVGVAMVTFIAIYTMFKFFMRM